MKKAEKALKDTVRKLSSTVSELKEAVAKHAVKCLKADADASDCVCADDQAEVSQTDRSS